MNNITLEQLYRESDDTRQGVDVPQDAQLAAEAVDWGYRFVGALVFATLVLLAVMGHGWISGLVR